MESGAARVMAIPASRRPCVLPSGDRRGAHMHERTENSPHAAINKREPFWCIVVGNRIEWALLQKSLLDDPKSVWQHTTHFKTVYVESVDLKTNKPLHDAGLTTMKMNLILFDKCVCLTEIYCWSTHWKILIRKTLANGEDEGEMQTVSSSLKCWVWACGLSSELLVMLK